VDLGVDNLGEERNLPEVVCSSKFQGEVCNSSFLEEVCSSSFLEEVCNRSFLEVVCNSNKEVVCNHSEVWVCLPEAFREVEHRHLAEVESQMEDRCRREEV